MIDCFFLLDFFLKQQVTCLNPLDITCYSILRYRLFQKINNLANVCGQYLLSALRPGTSNESPCIRHAMLTFGC